MDKDQTEIQRLRNLLNAAQMVGTGLSQLLMIAYERSDRLYDVTLRALVGLTKSACATCGAEPGTNIDCKGCQWVVDAQRALGDISLDEAERELNRT